MLKVIRVNVGHNEILTDDPALCVSLAHSDKSNETIYACRDWLRDCISKGEVKEIEEVRRYRCAADAPHSRPVIRRKLLTYIFQSESDAMAFRLTFGDYLFKEPEPPYFREKPWVN